MRKETSHIRSLLFSLGFAGSVLWCAALPAAETPKSSATPTAAAKPQSAAPKKVSRYRTGAMPESARTSYERTWGVDQLSTKLAESGQLVRFSYRVVDSGKAAALNEKSSSPQLLDEKVHAVLQVPTMEKVGQLRQSGAPENGKSYWMVFSNKGSFVKTGHRVSVVIGQFRVDGLVVQ